MTPESSEKWRERYIRLLTTPVEEFEDTPENLQAIEDLTDEGLIRAQVVHDKHGVVRGAAGLFIPTLKGRLFVEDQKAILRSKTFSGRLKANWPLFSGLVGVVVGWLLSSWHPSAKLRKDGASEQTLTRPALSPSPMPSQPAPNP